MLDPPTPATIVATIPEWLGRRPAAGETVLVGFTDNDPDLAVCLTLPPEREPDEEVAAIRQLVVDGAESVAIVAVTGSEDPPPARLEATLRFLASAAARYGHEVLGVLVIVPPQRGASGYWRGLPVPTRFRLPVSYTRPTEETS